MPIDRIAEVQAVVSQKIETAVGGMLRSNEHALTFVGVRILDHFRQTRVEGAFKKVGLCILQKMIEPLTTPFLVRDGFLRPDAVDEFERFLFSSTDDLRQLHLEQSPKGTFVHLHNQARIVRTKSASTVSRRRWMNNPAMTNAAAPHRTCTVKRIDNGHAAGAAERITVTTRVMTAAPISVGPRQAR